MNAQEVESILTGMVIKGLVEMVGIADDGQFLYQITDLGIKVSLSGEQ